MLLASDFEKEKRWADQVIEALFDGEAVYLSTDTHDFLTLYTRSASDSNSAVILMHGTGVHPDWDTVINPLRVGLAEQSYTTLSIQMPVLANEAPQDDYIALFPEVLPRVNASIDFLKAKGFKKIYLIGHSLGASMGSYYLRMSGNTVEGFIAIGLPSGIKDSPMDNLKNLTAITLPVLDLYGTEDLELVINSAALRVESSSINPSYSQIKVQGADHFFDGEENQLLETVLNWLDSQ